MFAYLLRRLALIPPTLFGIMMLTFVIVQFAPGGPVEQMVSRLKGTSVEATSRFANAGADTAGVRNLGDPGGNGSYRGAQGLPPEIIKEIEKQFGFDKPPLERFVLMMKNYLSFDFGQSFYRDRKVLDLVLEKLPVSVSLGLWTTLLTYLISIPLGIAKAVRDGTSFDVWTSSAVIVGYAIPGFLFAVLLIVLFAGGSFVSWFPLRGLTSPDFAQLSWLGKLGDYFWHLILPVVSMVVGGFATLTLLTKNSFLEEINKQYVVTARAKGLGENRVLYGHVFRNAMLIVIAGFPSALIGILFTNALLIESIFSLDGLGLLSYEAVINRDYPIVFATLYVFSLIGLLLNLVSDLTYHFVDPRIDFESRGV